MLKCQQFDWSLTLRCETAGGWWPVDWSQYTNLFQNYLYRQRLIKTWPNVNSHVNSNVWHWKSFLTTAWSESVWPALTCVCCISISTCTETVSIQFDQTLCWLAQEDYQARLVVPDSQPVSQVNSLSMGSLWYFLSSDPGCLQSTVSGPKTKQLICESGDCLT